MGQSKGGGYTQKPTLLPEQMGVLQQILSQVGQNQGQASEGFKQFLPGGGGGAPIAAEAQRNFQQETIPNILNSFGSGSKGSTSLNQALASGGSNLNSSLASMLSQLQLSAAQGLGNLGTNQASQGIQTPGFAYLQKQPPLWQQLLKTGIGAGSQAARGFLGG